MAKQILCTLGPASLNSPTIRRLDELRVDLFRLNLSHTPTTQIEELVELVRDNSGIPICLDTQGAQVRTGPFQDGTATLVSNTTVELVDTASPGDSRMVPLYPGMVLSQLLVGDLISLDFDAVPLQVTEVGSTCRARVLTGGSVGSNKAVSVDRALILPQLTDVDREALEIGLKLGIRHISLSFTNGPEDVAMVRQMVGADVQIIAKIESLLGLENLDGILKLSDAILIDRGDLAREVALEKLPFVQKDVIHRANRVNVPVFVATNLLESMVSSPRPTRAEANDVINTLLDGADGLVLAAETAIGKYPVGCVSMVQAFMRQHEIRTALPSSRAALDSTSTLLTPHGGRLVERVLFNPDQDSLREMRRLDIDQTLMMDVKQIAIGTFSPLQGFMGREELESVLTHSRLPDGTIWPMPVLLQLPGGFLDEFAKGETLALAEDGHVQALLHVGECFSYDLEDLATKWFGTSDRSHPGVNRLYQGANRFVAGQVDLLPEALGNRQPYELSPAQSRLIFQQRQWQKVVGFHTRNVPHRAHEYLQLKAVEDYGCDGVFIHPVTGPKKEGDYSGDIILKTYQLLIDKGYSSGNALLGGFVTYSRYAGPREAVFTALCRKNFGCSHFIVGRDHTGVGDFYSPEASQRYFDDLGDLGIQRIYFDEVYYCQRCQTHAEQCPHGREFGQEINGTNARGMLAKGEMAPEWYMRAEISRLILEEIKNGHEVFTS